TLLDAAGNVLGTCDRSLAFPVSPQGSSWAYARSNGVAAGADWAGACAAAQAEARERHHVLCAWYGYSVPTRRVLDDRTLRQLASLYDFEVYGFPAPANDAIEPSFSVIGCFGFPRLSEAPFLAGFGAAPDLQAAEERALRETLQRLGFLWGEAIPDVEPPLARTADYHQELYLWPPMQARVRAWLAGAHAGRCGSFPATAGRLPGFIDITPEHLAPRLRVAKLVTGVGLTLTFGVGHPEVEGAAALGAHPVA
ncbi:MAG TPA: YcaO-like family protein, partial [Polyangiaceae bacterium]